jgi:hypothetical protein
MKDVIWTLIIIWLIFKISNLLKGASKKSVTHQNGDQVHDNTGTQSSSHNDRDIKSAVRKHLNTEGEYVDFEEMK